MILKPFESNAPFHVEVEAHAKNPGILEVVWRVAGPLPRMGHTSLGVRAEQLWLDTVFEVFGRFEGSDAYWETNLSPHGLWNAYAFSSYRQDMAQTDSVTVSELEWLEQKEGVWRFISRYHFEPQSDPLHLGFACIFYPGPYHYALVHSRPKPDFHAPESFLLSV